MTCPSTILAEFEGLLLGQPLNECLLMAEAVASWELLELKRERVIGDLWMV